MSSCYECGKSLKRGEGTRRWVTVIKGESISRSFAKGGKRPRTTATAKRFRAKRTVCSACEKSSRFRKVLFVIGVLASIFIIIRAEMG